jgi:tetratricopeptide (TPR) repeat protein
MVVSQKRIQRNIMGKYLFLIMVIFFSLPNPVRSAGLDQTGLWNLYRNGEAAFRRGNELLKSRPEQAKGLFQKAALSFESIVREGDIENGKLYYNLGNIYFRLGDLGKAVLNYRRAEKFIPNDVNLQQNLAFARSRCLDKIDAKPQTRLFHALFFWHYDMSLFTRGLIFLVFFNLIWLCSTIYLFRKSTWLKRSVSAFAVLSILLAGSIGVEAFEQSRIHSGVVLAEEVIARKGDSTTFEPTFKEPLHAGTEFKLIEKRIGWYHIELNDGRRCWIPESAAALV